VEFSFERYKGSGVKLLNERMREVQVVDRAVFASTTQHDTRGQRHGLHPLGCELSFP
jgi:hypothetical protein